MAEKDKGDADIRAAAERFRAFRDGSARRVDAYAVLKDGLQLTTRRQLRRLLAALNPHL